MPKFLSDADMAVLDQQGKVKKFLSDAEMEALNPSTQSTQDPELTRIPKSSGLEAFGRGAAQGATFGFADELSGGAQAGLDYLGNTDTDLKAAYEKYRNAARERDELTQAEHPALALGGNVIGSAINALVTGGVGGEATLAEIMGRGAASGVAAGYGYSNKEDALGQAGDAAKGGLWGAALGGASHAIGEKVGPMVEDAKEYWKGKMPEWIRTFGNDQRARMLGFDKNKAEAELGKYTTDIESQMQNLGKIANEEGVTEGFFPSKGTMLRRAEDSLKKQGDVYNQVYSSLNDKLPAATATKDLFDQLKDEMEYDPYLAKKLQSSLTGDIAGPEDLQKAKTAIDRYAKWEAENPTDRQQIARKMSETLSKAIDTATEKGASSIDEPQLAESFQVAKSKYGPLEKMRKTLKNEEYSGAGPKRLPTTTLSMLKTGKELTYNKAMEKLARELDMAPQTTLDMLKRLQEKSPQVVQNLLEAYSDEE